MEVFTHKAALRWQKTLFVFFTSKLQPISDWYKSICMSSQYVADNHQRVVILSFRHFYTYEYSCTWKNTTALQLTAHTIPSRPVRAQRVCECTITACVYTQTQDETLKDVSVTGETVVGSFWQGPKWTTGREWVRRILLWSESHVWTFVYRATLH